MPTDSNSLSNTEDSSKTSYSDQSTEYSSIDSATVAAKTKEIERRSRLSVPGLADSKYDPDAYQKRLEYLQKFKTKITQFTSQYFANKCITKFEENIKKLNMGSDLEQIPKIVMSLSFDRKDPERISAADLIIHLINSKTIESEDLVKSFKIFLNRLSDMALDVPKIVPFMEYFIHRFIDSKIMSYGHSVNFAKLLAIFSRKNANETVKRIVHKIFDYYFATGELNECQRAMEEIDDETVHPLMVKYILSHSFDRKDFERELVSRMLARVVDDFVDSTFIKRKSLEEGISLILKSVPDMSADVPHVNIYMAKFIARSVYDESLAPAFLKRVREEVPDEAKEVLDEAGVLLQNRRMLQNVWGRDLESVEELTSEVDNLVEDFYSFEDDLEDFRKALLNMDHPHFHHEVIHRLFVNLLRHREVAVRRTGDLIGSLYKLGLSTENELVKGFSKVLEEISELQKEYPDVMKVYEELRQRVLNGKVLGEAESKRSSDRRYST